MDENKTTEIKEVTPKKVNLPEGVTMDNIQKYVLGTKKNGTPRAVYDVLKDFMPAKKHKKKKKKDKKDGGDNTYEVYLKKRGKKGKKKKSKHWHI